MLGALWFSNSSSDSAFFSFATTEREQGCKVGVGGYCDRGCYRVKGLVRRMGGCYDNYLYSKLSVVILQFREEEMNKIKVVGGVRLKKAVIFYICLQKWSVNLTIRQEQISNSADYKYKPANEGEQ